MQGPDLEDVDVRVALPFVVHDDAQVLGQQRAAQLRVLERDRVGRPDGGRIAGQPSQSGVVLGTDEAVRHDLDEAGTGERVADAIDACGAHPAGSRAWRCPAGDR